MSNNNEKVTIGDLPGKWQWSHILMQILKYCIINAGGAIKCAL